MERDVLERRLAQTEERLIDVDEQILRQREIIAELQVGGLSTTVATEIVDSLLRVRARHEHHRGRLRMELGNDRVRVFPD
jgi:hypothetical protein